MNLFRIPLNLIVISTFLSMQRLGVAGALSLASACLVRVCLPVSLPVSMCVCLHICVSACFCKWASPPLSRPPGVCLCVRVCICLCVSVSTCLCMWAW